MQMAQTNFHREAVWETTGRALLAWIVLQFNWFGKQTESFSEILADYQAAVQSEKRKQLKYTQASFLQHIPNKEVSYVLRKADFTSLNRAFLARLSDVWFPTKAVCFLCIWR